MSDPRDFSKINFSSFRQSFSSTTNFLKRRFSSGDLQGENDNYDSLDQQSSVTDQMPNRSSVSAYPSQPIASSIASRNSASSQPPQPPPQLAQQQASSELQLNFGIKNSTTSAPTSPAKNVSSFLSRATSLTTSVTSNVAGVASRISSTIKDTGKYKILMVIDSPNIDWSKYFRGKRLSGEFEIRVEQCEFRNLSINTNSKTGPKCLDQHSTRQFRPDFVLVRQHLRDTKCNYTGIFLGLIFGNIASINSLESVYNFSDRPLIYSQLLRIQRKLGRENFPLIEQSYYSSHSEMITNLPRFPCVIKIGHSHSGHGKVKVDNPADYNDIVSLIACANTYCTIEPYIDAKCDIHLQKIGNNYNAFMRKSVSHNWKSNVGSSLIEQCPVNERYKRWIDEACEVFGGLDLVAIQAILAKDGKEYIYKVTGSQMTLMGETQEEDRRLIADLVCAKMQTFCVRPVMTKQQSRPSVSGSSTSYQGDDSVFEPANRQQQLTNSGSTNYPTRPPVSGSTNPPRRGSQSSTGSADFPAINRDTSDIASSTGSASNNPSTMDIGAEFVGQTTQQIKGLFRKPSLSGNDTQNANKEDSEDTMRNLRKTFAGIFGDM